MFNYIMKEKELLEKLNTQLDDLKCFLIGKPVEEKGDCCATIKSSECLQDDIISNFNAIDFALTKLEIITNAIKGDK